MTTETLSREAQDLVRFSLTPALVIQEDRSTRNLLRVFRDPNTPDKFVVRIDDLYSGDCKSVGGVDIPGLMV